jgi:hypothetical protein
MPHEKINYPKGGANQLVVSWYGNAPGVNGIEPWVQVSIYPEGWKETSDAFHVDVSADEIGLLITTLRRARRKAYDSPAESADPDA